MVKCVFCGKEEPPLRGIHLITNIGTTDYYCSSKCRKNALKLKRDKRKLKWTRAFHEEREKSIAQEKRHAEQIKTVVKIAQTTKKAISEKNTT